jgi:UDP-N-acetylmuramoyl-tripeptide--D-alanyl-D-alanine ligase
MQLSQLIQHWGQPLGASVDGTQILGPICTDSRSLERGQLFVPLVGERFDGHGFLPQAAALGAQAALVQRNRKGEVPPGLLHWLVDDTLAAYQQLALWHRQALVLPVVAVTGSAGKTTTRELIRAVLQPLGPVLASVGNENNDIGVPLTLLKSGEKHRALVVEMGMRGLGEIERLSVCAEPDLAVITNIGTAHIGRLGSREAIATAKCEITTALKPGGCVVIPAGDPVLEVALAAVWSGRVLRVALEGEGYESQADWVGRLDASGQTLEVAGTVLPLPLEGQHNARNLMLALAVASELGLNVAALEALQVDLPGGRSRRLSIGGVSVLDETYNASPEAVQAALALLQRQPGRRFAVLGTMLELGDQSVALHCRVAQHARELGLDGLVIVDAGAEGQAMLAAAAGLPRLALVSSPAEAAEQLSTWIQPGDQLLLKASRGVALEQMLPLLATRWADPLPRG